MEKPIKRHKALQPLSRDHHHGLLLSWKIRQGIKKGIDATRMMAYARWFWDTQLKQHFEAEEKHIFPILSDTNTMVKKAISDHRRIARLLTSTDEDKKRALSLIEEELDNHIRFEERELFNVIQETATAKQLQLIEQIHSDGSHQSEWEDEFWK
ncbi:MAG TPA: hemerythrin domain-containing protein [Cyclobacteriaceae bacterium]|nr:cation-binding protein [Cytophagales bacterium]HMR57412.1 hemerythrin domain-containing protein [Cyclobacteriaceae bacterium]HRE68488.1 hemerythrin domain-containing protein [Cyclobacteriaceae bacterium]HRF34989.1 hemerythrin domain-containing protein [Cyclobacteriaceae bacterium]